jgi:phage tail-like protein
MAAAAERDRRVADPFHAFSFVVEFTESPLGGASGSQVPLCSGAFSLCTGIEATMEPKVIKQGGQNYGANQRVGQVTFATVVLKRGMTRARDLWRWFDFVTRGGSYAHRLTATIRMKDAQGNVAITWKLQNAMPVKFKAADLDARASDVAIEELHLAHEGLTLVAS